MHELMNEFKELRLHCIAGAWEELSANGGPGIDTSRWLIENLLQALSYTYPQANLCQVLSPLVKIQSAQVVKLKCAPTSVDQPVYPFALAKQRR